MMQIDLNCDCGESFGEWKMGNDSALFPLISSVNIACGAHAGDPDIMRQTIRLAQQYDLAIGAHPGYPDLQGFGRRVIPMTPNQVQNSVLAQIGALYALARAEGAELRHVKPHGALYNQAAKDPKLAQAIAQAVAAFDKNLILVGLAGSALIEAGISAGLRVAREAFVDRVYERDGSLRNRNLPDAILRESQQSQAQVLGIVTNGYAISIEGERVAIKADTFCVHSDTASAVEHIQQLRQALSVAGIEVKALV
jgi:UPF0271 protein